MLFPFLPLFRILPLKTYTLKLSLILVYAVPIDTMSDKERGDTKDHSLNQWFLNFSEADELLKLAAARQQVIVHYSIILSCLLNLVVLF